MQSSTHNAAEEDGGKAPKTEQPKEESDYEEEVDESVREDMDKLEDTFPGISDRFRLVNRIGEGTDCLFGPSKSHVHDVADSTFFKGRSRPYTKRRICSTTITRTIGIFSDKHSSKMHGPAHRLNGVGLMENQ